jgi:hypothetical protein
MSLKGRLKSLESGASPASCLECGTTEGRPAEFTMGEGSPPWEEYPESLLCSGCGRALKFTLKLGGALGGPGTKQEPGSGSLGR